MEDIPWMIAGAIAGAIIAVGCTLGYALWSHQWLPAAFVWTAWPAMYVGAGVTAAVLEWRKSR